MTLVVASSTARAMRSAVASGKPAVSAIFLVRSRTRARYEVWLGNLTTRLGLAGRRGRALNAKAPPTPSGRGLPALAEALHRLRLRRVRPVQVVEAQDLEDVVDGLVEPGQPQVPPAAADLLDGPHHGAQAGAGDVGQLLAVDHDLVAAPRG